MQRTILSLSSHGVPLCVSPISARFPLSKEMADHDRRREAVKRRLRSQSARRQGLIANVRSRRTQNGVVSQLTVASVEDLALRFGYIVADDEDDEISCNVAKAA